MQCWGEWSDSGQHQVELFGVSTWLEFTGGAPAPRNLVSSFSV
jgi:hypothetical protein